MIESKPASRRIQILRDEVSRKIAAGEVIDRPFSIVRELLDNAIDAGAGTIDVFLEAGGTSRIRVVDDGAGMSREDLELCWRPHATSKIESEEDLLTVSSLGFRGEALSSVAVCGRLSIVSAEQGGGPAHRLDVRGGKLLGLEPCQGRAGTVVDVSELFFNFPARKKFLRSISAESGLCRGMFVDRAVAHPSIAFRLYAEGELKLSLPPAAIRERISLAFEQHLDTRLLLRASHEGHGFAATVVAAGPELKRKDRKLIQVFVNRRRVAEFSLVQAVEYGYSGYMPGGWYPAAFVFVEIDPGLVDFNIHPAKKEVRFRNLPDVHQAVVSAVKELLGATTGRADAAGTSPAGQALQEAAGERFFFGGTQPLAMEARAGVQPVPALANESARFIGRVFDVFLVFELPDRLLLLDQHAAHEKVIFERLGRRPPTLQEMLFPLSFDVSEDEDARLARSLADLDQIGIACRRVGPRTFEVTALSADFLPLKEEDLVELIRGAGKERWRESLRATAACRLAIKEGDPVDPAMAAELCARALAFENPRCPHGRPLWHEMSRESLLRMVGRTLPERAGG